VGGSPQPPPPRNLGQELGGIYNQFNTNTVPSFNSYAAGQPLLQGSSNLALLGQSQLPGVQGQYTGDINALQGNISQNTGFQSQLKAYQQMLAGLQPGISAGLAQTNPIVASGGALTPQLKNLADQQAEAGFASRGNLYGNQSVAGDLLNRDQYKQQRFNSAVQNQATLTGEQAGLIGQGTGITGQNAGLNQANAGLTLNQAGLTNMGQQAIGQAINPALQTQNSSVGEYASLINPLLNYGSDLYNTNYNAQAASNIAGSNKTGGTIGGIASVVGSVAAAY